MQPDWEAWYLDLLDRDLAEGAFVACGGSHCVVEDAIHETDSLSLYDLGSRTSFLSPCSGVRRLCYHSPSHPDTRFWERTGGAERWSFAPPLCPAGCGRTVDQVDARAPPFASLSPFGEVCLFDEYTCPCTGNKGGGMTSLSGALVLGNKLSALVLGLRQTKEAYVGWKPCMCTQVVTFDEFGLSRWSGSLEVHIEKFTDGDDICIRLPSGEGKLRCCQHSVVIEALKLLGEPVALCPLEQWEAHHPPPGAPVSNPPSPPSEEEDFDPIFHETQPLGQEHIKVVGGGETVYMTFSASDPESLEMKAWKLKRERPEFRVYVYEFQCPGCNQCPSCSESVVGEFSYRECVAAFYG